MIEISLNNVKKSFGFKNDQIKTAKYINNQILIIVIL